jgi:hypothetical protein
MEINKHTKIKLTVVTMTALTFLISSIVMIAPPQQVDGLSTYDTGADNDVANNGKTDQPLQQDELGNTAQPSPTTPAVPTTNCAMNTIESLESFLGCLGAK